MFYTGVSVTWQLLNLVHVYYTVPNIHGVLPSNDICRLTTTLSLKLTGAKLLTLFTYLKFWYCFAIGLHVF